jgi:hypothetical protein
VTVAETASVRRLAGSLSGYLCGTHSGFLAGRGARQQATPCDPDRLAAAHRALAGADALTADVPDHALLGSQRWEPAPDATRLRERLLAALEHPAVLELVLFGSQARGSTTGFSDVDAVLAVRDEAVEDPSALRSLRRRVLVVERAIVTHQPMQHHGLEVLTPKLLPRAGEALGVPSVALAETRSLYGRALVARLAAPADRAAREQLAAMLPQLATVAAWPRHPWDVHRLVSMFELVPALYLQARGCAAPKSRSFGEVAAEFPRRWWPYEALEEVRERWPRTSRPELRLGALVARNPWDAVVVWRRLPLAPAAPVRRLLTQECLLGLQALAGEMGARVR